MKKLYLLLSIVAITISTVFAGSFPTITLDDLQKAITENTATVIDVNGTASYKAGHISTALDYEAIKNNLEAKLPRDKSALIVAYGPTGKTGTYLSAAESIKKLGYTNIKQLAGGLAAWKNAGNPLEKSE